MNGSKSPDVGTRAFLGTYRLVDHLFGVRAYRLNGELAEEVVLAKSDRVATFYEVAVFAEGSWWLPTSTQEDPAWGGSVDLQTSGTIPSVNVLRPMSYYLWIPRQNLGSVFLPVTLPGQVGGQLPDAPPPKTTTGPPS